MISDQDFERLSAYVDNQLPVTEKSTLEARLAREPELKSALDDLRLNARALRALPVLKPPRSFTLSAAQAQAIRPAKPSPWIAWLPTLRLATAVATFAFIAVLGLDLSGAGNFAAREAAPSQTEEMAQMAPAAAQNKTADASGTPMMEAYAPPLVEQSGTPSAEGPGGVTTYGAEDATGTGTLAPEATPAPDTRSALTATEIPLEETAVALVPDAYPAPEAGNLAHDSANFDATAAAPEPITFWRPWTIGLGMLAVALGLATWIMTRRR